MSQSKTVVEKIQARFAEFAKQILDEFGEPASLALVIDWAIGKEGFPPGFFSARAAKIHPSHLMGMCEQLSSMALRLLEINDEQLQKWRAFASELEAVIDRNKKELREQNTTK